MQRHIFYCIFGIFGCFAGTPSAHAMEATPTPLGAAALIAGGITHQKSPLEVTTVFFRSNSAVLEQACWPALRSVSRLLDANADLSVVLSGHADARGSATDNQVLGLRRAQSVQAFLVRHGVPAERILIESHGEKRAAGNILNLEEQAFDRRVSVLATPRGFAH